MFILISFLVCRLLIQTIFFFQTVFTTALDKCNSCKFFEIDSGAYLFRILTKWFPLKEVNKENLATNSKMFITAEYFDCYLKFLFEEAKQQLILTKHDILKSATHNTPFYGVVSALLMIGFSDGSESRHVSHAFLEDLTNMAENAVNFFLNAFSSKSSNLGMTEFIHLKFI